MKLKNPRGYVVEHLESKIRYAVSVSNFNPKIHKKIRDLKPWETVAAYKPKSAKNTEIVPHYVELEPETKTDRKD